jgi:hypothetical protein
VTTIKLNLLHSTGARSTLVLAFATFSRAGGFIAELARPGTRFHAHFRVHRVIAALTRALMPAGEFHVAFSSTVVQLNFWIKNK